MDYVKKNSVFIFPWFWAVFVPCPGDQERVSNSRHQSYSYCWLTLLGHGSCDIKRGYSPRTDVHNTHIQHIRTSMHTVRTCCEHYCDVIMSAMASNITSAWIVCSTVCSGADQRKHQSSASLAFVRWIHRWPVDSPHKGPVTRKLFSFDDVIMKLE